MVMERSCVRVLAGDEAGRWGQAGQRLRLLHGLVYPSPRFHGFPTHQTLPTRCIERMPFQPRDDEEELRR